MAEKVVSVRLQARVEGFTAGMSKAKASVDDLTKAAAPSKTDAFGKMADKAALAGLGVATAVGVAVKRFAEFDQAMSAVQANSGATGESLESLRQAAITMGADSQFSAKEAAQGINEMAKAGVETADILGGGLKGALDLAAAGQIGVAQAAEAAATAMTQFGLSGDKVPHIADLLANAANKAQGGVGDMAQALNQAGLVANSMGLSIEETTAGLTAFASAGLLGSDAGTSFKTMLQRLAAPTGEAAGELKRLKISAYDSQGEFIGLANVAGQLTKAMDTMEPKQRAASMSIIFGSDAVRAANVLYTQGEAGIRQWTDAVNEQGTAAKQAAALTDNLKGDIERLGGALDSVLIQSGSGANSSLRGLTQGLTGLVDSIGEVPGPLLLLGGVLTSTALLAPKGAVKWKEYNAQLDAISETAPRAARGMRALGAASAIGAGVIVAAEAFDALGKEIAELQDIRPKGVETATAEILKGKDAAEDFNRTMGLTGNVARFDSVVNKLVLPTRLFGGELEAAKSSMEAYDAALAGMVQSGNGERAAEFLDATLLPAEKLNEILPQYAESLKGVDNQAVLTATGQGTMTEATDVLAQSAEDAEKALEGLREAIEGLGSPLAAQRAAERDFQASIDGTAERLTKRKELEKELRDVQNAPLDTNKDGTVRSGAADRKAEEIARIRAELEKYSKGFDVNTEAGRANQAALDNIRTTTLAKVQADFDAVNSTKGTEAATLAATKAMQTGRDAFIQAATAAGMTKDEAGKLATNLGLVPKDVKILVSQSGAAEAQEAIDAAARDRIATIYVQRKISDERDRRQELANLDGLPPVKRWQGGAIYGPGSGTSDSVAALLSNGEHVLTAAEVQKLGGQGAVYAMRAAIQRGNLPKFAVGGAVGQFAPARLTSSSSASSGMGRQFVSGSLDMGNGLTGFVRAIVADEMSGRNRADGLVSY